MKSGTKPLNLEKTKSISTVEPNKKTTTTTKSNNISSTGNLKGVKPVDNSKAQ